MYKVQHKNMKRKSHSLQVYDSNGANGDNFWSESKQDIFPHSKDFV